MKQKYQNSENTGCPAGKKLEKYTFFMPQRLEKISKSQEKSLNHPEIYPYIVRTTCDNYFIISTKNSYVTTYDSDKGKIKINQFKIFTAMTAI